MSIYCPDCKAEMEPTAAQCPRCGFTAQPAHHVPAHRPVRAARTVIPVEAIVHLLVDRTGSTDAFKSGVPLAAQHILGPIEAKASSVRVSLSSGGDLECGETVVLHLDRGSVAEAVAAAQRITYGGGGDAAETHLDSLAEVLSTIPPATHKQRNSVVAFFTDESKPLRDGRTPAQLGADFKARGVFPVLVCTPGCALLDEFLSASGGLMFPISNNPSPSDLAKVAEVVAKSIVASLQGAKTTPVSVQQAAVAAA